MVSQYTHILVDIQYKMYYENPLWIINTNKINSLRDVCPKQYPPQIKLIHHKMHAPNPLHKKMM